MTKEWQCTIRNDDFGMRLKLYIFRQTHDGEVEFLVAGGNGSEPSIQKIAGDQDGIPTLIIPRLVGADIIKAIADALDRVGVRSDSDARISGLLDATNKHLEDMRTLVFRGKNPHPNTSTQEFKPL